MAVFNNSPAIICSCTVLYPRLLAKSLTRARARPRLGKKRSKRSIVAARQATQRTAHGSHNSHATMSSRPRMDTPCCSRSKHRQLPIICRTHYGLQLTLCGQSVVTRLLPCTNNFFRSGM